MSANYHCAVTAIRFLFPENNLPPSLQTSISRLLPVVNNR